MYVCVSVFSNIPFDLLGFFFNWAPFELLKQN